MNFRLLAVAIATLIPLGVYAEPPATVPAFSIDAGDLVKAAVELDADGHSHLVLTLNSKKHAEFTKLSCDRLNREFRYVINGKPTMTVTFREPIYSNTLDLTYDSPEAALKIAEALIRPKPLGDEQRNATFR